VFADIAHAMGQAPAGAEQPSPIQAFAPLIIIFAIFYFLLIRPQQKRAKEQKEMLDNLKKGDKIVTTGGIYGLIEGLTDKVVTIKIAENVKIRISRNAVAQVRTGSDD